MQQGTLGPPFGFAVGLCFVLGDLDPFTLFEFELAEGVDDRLLATNLALMFANARPTALSG